MHTLAFLFSEFTTITIKSMVSSIKASKGLQLNFLDLCQPVTTHIWIKSTIQKKDPRSEILHMIYEVVLAEWLIISQNPVRSTYF